MFHGLAQTDAEQAILSLNATPLTIHLSQPHHKRALEIGINHHLPVYDSLYIALAEYLDVPLISEDKRQIKIAEDIGLNIKPATDFPEYKSSTQ